MTWTVERCLREDPRLSRTDIDSLKEWHKKQPHLPPITDLELVSFLHSNEYDVEATKVAIDKYFTIRTQKAEIFGNRDILLSVNAQQGTFGRFADLPQRDSNGYRVLAFGLQPAEDLSSLDCFRLFFLGLAYMDTLIREWPICPGYVFILDAQNLQFGHLMRMSISCVRTLITYVQEAEPIRMKAVHITNMNFLANKIMLLVKPLMGKDLQKLLHFHSGEMEAFYEAVPRSNLPLELGGTCDSFMDFHKKALKMLADNREQLIKDEELQVKEYLRPKRSKTSKEV